MECNLACQNSGERCWNSKALQQYARRLTASEAAFVSEHEYLTVQPGEISCEGVVENVYGLGKVCLPLVESSLIVYQDIVMDFPGNVQSLRQVKGFKLFKSDGSPWDLRFNINKTETLTP